MQSGLPEWGWVLSVRLSGGFGLECAVVCDKPANPTPTCSRVYYFLCLPRPPLYSPTSVGAKSTWPPLCETRLYTLKCIPALGPSIVSLNMKSLLLPGDGPLKPHLPPLHPFSAVSSPYSSFRTATPLLHARLRIQTQAKRRDIRS